MKKTLAVLTLLAGAVSGYSQGQIYMGDYGNTDFQISIWSPQGTAEVTGNTAANNALTGTSDIPAGTTAYTGSPLGGGAPVTTGVSSTDYSAPNLWSVELYAAAGNNAAASSLAPIPSTIANFYANTATSIGDPGLYNSTAVVTLNGQNGTPTVPIGSPVTVAIAAWYNGNGAYTSYTAAMTAGVPYGMSPTGTENANGAPSTPPDLPGPGEPQTLAGGITSFSLNPGTITPPPVPEPSTIALGLVGASTFLMRLRRKA